MISLSVDNIPFAFKTVSTVTATLYNDCGTLEMAIACSGPVFLLLFCTSMSVVLSHLCWIWYILRTSLLVLLLVLYLSLNSSRCVRLRERMSSDVPVSTEDTTDSVSVLGGVGDEVSHRRQRDMGRKGCRIALVVGMQAFMVELQDKMDMSHVLILG